jgi:hypothetical protein
MAAAREIRSDAWTKIQAWVKGQKTRAVVRHTKQKSRTRVITLAHVRFEAEHLSPTHFIFVAQFWFVDFSYSSACSERLPSQRRGEVKGHQGKNPATREGQSSIALAPP